ncbi:MAG: DUF3344 domain-containing protein [Methanobrevibacter sp.]|jgi:hypothetical protein|nr:DUF3344 domain-containing protein [Methanobrevibacter sp.]
MNIKYIIVLLCVILSITVAAVIADTNNIVINGLDPEYTSGNAAAVYEGTQNQLNTTINSDDSYTGEAILYADGVEVAKNSSVQLNSGDNQFNIVDPTIRPITNNGYGVNNITYTLNLTVNGVTKSYTRSISLVYNGYLGKEFSPSGDDSVMEEHDINGNVLIQTEDHSSYLGNNINTRNDNLQIDHDNIVKTFAYVPYNWGNNFDTVTLTCNGNSVSEYKRFDDKSNLGSYGNRTYGVRIFDITAYVHKGDNNIAITKVDGSAALYPTVFVTLYNESNGSNKKVYLNNGADLLYTNYNKLDREVSSNSIFNIENTNNIKNAKWYSIFSSIESDDNFDLFFNNELIDVEHEGNDNITDYVTEDVTKFITNGANKASFKLENDKIETSVALSQILVLENNENNGFLDTDPHSVGLFKTGFPLGILLVLLSISAFIIRRRK